MKDKLFDKLINFHIGNDLLERLDFFSKRKGWRRNFVIREAIKEYLDRKKIEDITKKNPKFGRWMYCKYCYKNVRPIPNYLEGIVECSECGAGIMRIKEEK